MTVHREQLLNKRYSRRLITMTKVQRYDAAQAQAYFAARGELSLAIDRMHEVVCEARAPEADSASCEARRFRSKRV